MYIIFVTLSGDIYIYFGMSNYKRQFKNSPERTTCARKMFLMVLNKFTKYGQLRTVIALAYFVKSLKS